MALGGYTHGPPAATDGTRAALAETPALDAMMLVEGISDQIAVETLAVRHGRDLTAERVAVVAIGGAGAIGRVLAEHASATLRLVALCDAGEEALVRRRIEASGLQVSVFVCVPDLEAELISAVGVDRALAVLGSQGDLGSFTTLQKQVAWRGQPAEAQLRRFIGAGARRKLRYARLLTDAAVDLNRAPRPLAEALTASCCQAQHRDRPSRLKPVTASQGSRRRAGSALASVEPVSEILDVDLLAFERGTAEQRRAVVDGVRHSLQTGFVYTRHDLSEDMLDTAYAMLAEFFSLDNDVKVRYQAPGTNGQTGYTGLLVETAASSDKPDWKEMLNWATPIAPGHPLRRKHPGAYPDQVMPEEAVPGITEVLYRFHDSIADLQRRFLRVIAEGIGCHESFFDDMVKDGPTLTRAIRYPSMGEVPTGGHEWAAQHGDINLITALPRATAAGLQVKVDDRWVDAVAPEGQVIINTGIMLERLTNGVIPIGWHRVVAAPGYEGERYSVVQFCHPRPWTVLAPVPSCCTPEHPQQFSAISAAEALDEVLYEINLVEAARRVAADAAG